MQTITPEELYKQIQAGGAVRIVDVRSPEEFAEVHIPGAELYPIVGFDVTAFLASVTDAEQKVYVACAAGMRAARVCEMLAGADFANTVLIVGGTKAWVEAGLPVDTAKV